MLVVGLTGNIASGKSTVARRFAAHGVPVIDSDVLAREAVGLGTPALEQIAARWGAAVLAPDGTLNRAALRARVFADPSERAALNHIVHPVVEHRRRELIETARARGARVVVCDIPLLFEVGLDRQVDLVIFVDAPSDLRRSRLIESRGLDAAEASQMIDAQWPAERKRARAEFVIENDGSLEALEARVDAVWRDIETRAARASS
jgi:dephospho-CoA kinase